MEIESSFVTFDQSKLLRKNGFDQETFAFYWSDTKQLIVDNDKGRHNGCHIQAPEQWQVVEWFRIKYNIWINVTIGMARFGYHCSITKVNILGASDINFSESHYNTPKEAYSEAITYILNILESNGK